MRIPALRLARGRCGVMVIRAELHRLHLRERDAIQSLVEAKISLLSSWCASGREWKCLAERGRLARRVAEQERVLRGLCRLRSHPASRQPTGWRIFQAIYALLRSVLLLLAVAVFVDRMGNFEAVAIVAPTM